MAVLVNMSMAFEVFKYFLKEFFKKIIKYYEDYKIGYGLY